MHSENAGDRPPMMRLHRSGSPLERDDDILMYNDGTIKISLGGQERPGVFVFHGQQAFVHVLLDYFFNSLKFFALKNTYEQEEQIPEHTTVAVPDRVWDRSSLDSVYMIRADMFNHHNEIAFSYSHCPDNLWRLRMAIDKLFYSAKHVRQSGGPLVELIRDLIA